MKNADEIVMPIRLSASLSVCLLALICECLQKNIPEDTTKTCLGSSTYTCFFQISDPRINGKCYHHFPKKTKEHSPTMIPKPVRTWSQHGPKIMPRRVPGGSQKQTRILYLFSFFSEASWAPYWDPFGIQFSNFLQMHFHIIV